VTTEHQIGRRVELWSPQEAKERAAEVWRVYEVVFADLGSEQEWRETTYEPHCARRGFRFAAALDSDRLVGFAYGYIGDLGQYWPDRVASALSDDIVAEWVGGHFEFVELAVLADYRRLGLGGALHDALMSDLDVYRALLSTDADDTPAVLLYRSRGWTSLGILEPGVQVMGWHS
jgi:ribosomal protein S18 acetylase RimI-like enzyme